MACVKVEKNNYTVEPLRQWDLNRVLTIHGLSLATAPEVHFAHDSDKLAVVRQSTMDDSGVISATVPNALLQKPLRLNVYICSRDGNVFRTLFHMVVPVEKRAMPSDWDGATEDEIYSLEALSAEVVMVPSTAGATVEKVLNKDGTWTLKFSIPDKGATEAANAASASATSAKTAEQNAVKAKNTAETAAQSAESSMTDAEKSAQQAQDSANRIENMGVQATTLPSDRVATVEKQSGADAVTLVFGIPRGKDGYTPKKGVDYFDGKSAYQYAVDSGYTGTEKEFMEKLAAEAGVFYVADGGTPHSVDTQVFDGGTPFTTDDIKLDGGTP